MESISVSDDDDNVVFKRPILRINKSFCALNWTSVDIFKLFTHINTYFPTFFVERLDFCTTKLVVPIHSIMISFHSFVVFVSFMFFVFIVSPHTIVYLIVYDLFLF